MMFFTRLMLLSVIGLGFCLPLSLAAEENGKVREPAPEWQIQGALAAYRDEIPKVKALGLKKLFEIGAIERISLSEFGQLLKDKRSGKVLIELTESEIPSDYFYQIFLSTTFVENSLEESLPCKGKILRLVSLIKQRVDKKLAYKYIDLGRMGLNSIDTCLYFDLLISSIESTGNYAKIISEIVLQSISHTEPQQHVDFVCSYAVNFIGMSTELIDILGKFPEDQILEITKLLELKKKGVALSTLCLLSKLQDSQGLTKECEFRIEKLLKHESIAIRGEALSILVRGKSWKKYAPKIAEFSQYGNIGQEYAVLALGKLAELEEKYVLQLIDLLEEDANASVKTLIFSQLASLGERKTLKDYFSNHVNSREWNHEWEYFVVLKNNKLLDLPQLIENLKNNIGILSVSNPETTEEIIADLLYYPEKPIESISQIEILLDNRYTFISALKALKKLGEPLKNYLPQIIKQLQGDSPRYAHLAALVLADTRELDISLLPVILNPLYLRKPNEIGFRATAHIIGAGKANIEILLKWLGDPQENYPETITYDEAKAALNVFATVWPHALRFPQVREDLEKQITVVITQRDIRWQASDLPLLQTQLDHLRSVNSNYAGNVKITIDTLQTKRYVFLVAQLWLIHAGFWLALIILYPKSRRIQAIFFWNPYVRKIMGVGYVNLALTWIPYLRHKLLMPFKELLIADADLKDFNELAYFDQSAVAHKRTKELTRLLDTIPKIDGQIILEGDSGFGKSMFLRHLVNQSQRTLLYLPASKCAKGIMAAIEAKLYGVAQDSAFLKSLIYSGALDICIDGLNEVCADVRAELAQFLDSYAKGNILIATQPLLDWIPPKTAETYVLQPLSENQLVEFLISRYSTLPDDEILLYQQKCRDYLTKVATQPPEILKAIQRLLANPMDATVIAQMLAHGEKPDIFRLQEQHYQLMAKTYESYFHKSFPLKEFSTHIYQMRLDNRAAIPHEQFNDEITCMERFKMVFSRQSLDSFGRPRKEWYFRHDKVMEFFIVQTFLGDTEKPLEHLDDPRFRGVYFLLANLLPLKDAMMLREQLIEYAADTQDHLVSDKFIQLLRSRKILVEV